MKAVILAAGYATRLYPLTRNIPKCLLEIGGRTILDFLCEKLLGVEGLEEILIVTNARFFDQLTAWKEASLAQIPISVLNDGTDSNQTRLGAIGDLQFALEQGHVDSDILLLASDNLFEDSLSDFAHFTQTNPEDVSLAVHDLGDPKLASKKFGVIEADPATGEVLSLEEKPEFPKASLIGVGIYYFPKESLSLVKEYLNTKESEDAPGHYISWLQGRLKIFSFVLKGMWYDIGDLKALEEAKAQFKV